MYLFKSQSAQRPKTVERGGLAHDSLGF